MTFSIFTSVLKHESVKSRMTEEEKNDDAPSHSLESEEQVRKELAFQKEIRMRRYNLLREYEDKIRWLEGQHERARKLGCTY